MGHFGGTQMNIQVYTGSVDDFANIKLAQACLNYVTRIASTTKTDDRLLEP